MTIEVINLNKLLRFCALAQNTLIGELRSDLRMERDKLLGKKSGGGHFHHPWWTEAKRHVGGYSDLEVQTPILIDILPSRKRLYEPMTERFLDWLKYVRRTTNAKLGWKREDVHAHYPVPGLNLVVKVDNLLSLELGQDHHRLVYPYFSEEPALTETWARVGLWLMSEAFTTFSITDMEILDVLRGRSFGGGSLSLRGDEETRFQRRYAEILEAWKEMRPEYGL